MTSPRVLAVILTYCAPESLQHCVDGVAGQDRSPQGLLIVDNTGAPLPAASRPHLHGIPTTMLRTGENLGPAGGHAVGLTEFMADPRWTHAWVMDDDCVPESGALAALVDRAIELPAPSLVFPNWINGQDARIMKAPAWCGFLISREAVERAGLPRAELFWWAEDTEYLRFRMPRRGVTVARQPAAAVWHWPVRRAAGRPPWKTYYEIRNSTWYRLHVQRSPDAYRRWLRTLAKLTGAALRTQPRGEHLSALARGLLHGLRGRLGRTMIPPPPWPKGEDDDKPIAANRRGSALRFHFYCAGGAGFLARMMILGTPFSASSSQTSGGV